MISKKMEKALNDQIAMEGNASFLYLSMASWCDQEGLVGCTSFMRRQSDEERVHMLKIFDYLSEVDAHAIAPAISKPEQKWESVKDMFEEVLSHEQKVTQSIHKLMDLALEEDDYTTSKFLEWYVDEQREEEALMRTILDRIKLIGNGPQSLFYIDKEVESINGQTENA